MQRLYILAPLTKLSFPLRGKIIKGGDLMRKITSFISITLLFTFIISYPPPAKQAVAEVDNTKTVQLGGEPFGIKMFSDGVLVIGVEDTIYGSDTPSPAVIAGIKENDIIKSIDGDIITSNEHFTKLIRNSGGNELILNIDRNGKLLKLKITPEYDLTGIPRVGLWIKDSAAGIGTITYYDTENSNFGALGHGICESQTGKLIPLSYGEVAKASISDVVKSENGKVGSLNGYFEGDILGEAYLNSENGIFGSLSCQTYSETIEVADKNEVKIGDAYIYCTIDGNKKERYEIKIKRLSHGSNQAMVIEITDPDLLSVTGGIVQGMSGSPIVQNGKLVGALTHVLVNIVTSGYGIYIEDMMNIN